VDFKKLVSGTKEELLKLKEKRIVAMRIAQFKNKGKESVLPVEEHLRLNKMFKTWGKSDCRMHTFLASLDPYAEYEYGVIKDLVKEAHPKMICSELYVLKRGNSSGYGMILQKLSNGHSRLYPELIEEFLKYF
jgi:hypothetical protein